MKTDAILFLRLSQWSIRVFCTPIFMRTKLTKIEAHDLRLHHLGLSYARMKVAQVSDAST